MLKNHVKVQRDQANKNWYQEKSGGNFMRLARGCDLPWQN